LGVGGWVVVVEEEEEEVVVEDVEEGAIGCHRGPLAADHRLRGYGGNLPAKPAAVGRSWSFAGQMLPPHSPPRSPPPWTETSALVRIRSKRCHSISTE